MKSIIPIFLGLFIFFRCSMISEVSKENIVRGPDFAPYEGLKTTVAVLNFTNHGEQGGEKLGSAVADMLVSLLVRSDRFIVLERQYIDRIFQEQALGQSGIIGEESAAQVGKLLGVQSVITGNILEAEQRTGGHEFGDEDDDEEEDDKRKNKNPWALALKATVGHVKCSFRIINATTGEIVISDHVSATEIRPGFGIRTKDVDVTDTFEFDETIMGLAMRKAVNMMAKKIAGLTDMLEWEGRVVHVKADSIVYFTPGLRSGVKIGDAYVINRKIETTDSLEIVEPIEAAGVVVIGFVGDKVTKAVLHSSGPVERGDRVRRLKREPEFRETR